MKPRNPTGIIIDSLGNTRFRVKMDADGREVIAYLAGRMRLRKVYISVGDHVEVQLDPNGGKATNRIVWRV